MATYVVGDIHGCFDDFQRLLEIIKFHRSQDRLWLVGDVVNRGAGNAAMLRWLIEHEDRITLVLGNHDLHLLAAHANEGQLRKRDTFGDVFAATDGAALCDWLRKRPLAHAENGFLMIHAGVLPMWETETTLALAAEVEAALRGDGWRDFVADMYGDSPAEWSDDLSGTPRLRVIVNALTRLRICSPEGEMKFPFSGSVEEIPDGFMPWFKAPSRRTKGTRILCGHWSALGVTRQHGIFSLDSGSFHSGVLTALRLSDERLYQTTR